MFTQTRQPTASAAEYSAIARDVFRDAPLLFRCMQRWRPYICPFELLVEYVPLGAEVLDIGCGAGLFLALLATLGRQVRGVGVDSSEHAIRCAQQVSTRINQQSLGSNLQFHHLLPDQALPAGPFNVVGIIDVTHHIPPAGQRRFLESAIERVAPGGLLVYKDMASTPMWRRTGARLHDLLIARQWIHEAPLSVVRPWIESRGLACTQCGSANRYWYGHEFAVFQRPL